MKKKLLKAVLFVGINMILLMFVMNASLNNNRNDKKFIQQIFRDWGMSNSLTDVHSSFENEVAFISRIQDSTVSQIINGDVAPENSTNIEYLYTNKKGLCFNRSFFQEKLLKFAGFKTRHIYVYFKYDSSRTVSGDLFNSQLLSHAMFEVKTSKGWMAVETNGNWLGLDKQGNPMTLGEVKEHLKFNNLNLAKSVSIGGHFYDELAIKHNFKFLYGVYSRHGGYLKSGPLENFLQHTGLCNSLPDYNLRELLFNL